MKAFCSPSSAPYVLSLSRSCWFFRVSLLGLQAVGSFPYTWSSSSRRYEFSLGLALWSVFVKIALGFGLYAYTTAIGLQHGSLTGLSIGHVTYISSLTCFHFSVYLALVGVLLRSPNLAKLLFQLQEPSEGNRTGHSPRCATVTYAFAEICIIVTWGLITFTTHGHPVLQLQTSRVFFAIMYSLEIAGYIAVYLVFEVAASRLSTQLVEDVKEALAPPASPPSFLSDQAKDVAPLVLLEKQIRKAETLRRDLISCFFEATTLILAVSVLGLVGLIFQVLVVGSFGQYVLMTLFGCFSGIFRAYRIGQDFEDEVAKAVDLLKTFSSKTTDDNIKSQVFRLLWFMEPLRTFSMFGWYDMNKSIILKVAREVVTYLVVLLQIGNQVFRTSSMELHEEGFRDHF